MVGKFVRCAWGRTVSTEKQGAPVRPNRPVKPGVVYGATSPMSTPGRLWPFVVAGSVLPAVPEMVDLRTDGAEPQAVGAASAAAGGARFIPRTLWNKAGVLALVGGLVSGCSFFPSKHERGEFRYLGPCDERVSGAAWCGVVGRPWNEPMPL